MSIPGSFGVFAPVDLIGRSFVDVSCARLESAGPQQRAHGEGQKAADESTDDLQVSGCAEQHGSNKAERDAKIVGGLWEGRRKVLVREYEQANADAA